MGGDPTRFATSTAAAVAAIMGTKVAVVAVISVTTTMPVTGARTVAPKNAAIPTSAIGTASCEVSSGHTAAKHPTNSSPHRAPTASSGANSPPGTAAEYERGPAMNRTASIPMTTDNTRF